MELSVIRRDRASAQCECRELMARLDKLTTADGDSEALQSEEQDSFWTAGTDSFTDDCFT